MRFLSGCRLLSWLVAWVAVGLVAPCWAQVPPEFAQQMQRMSETFAKQAEQFVPGIFSELTPEQMARLEKIKVSPRDETQFGSQVLKNYEASLSSRKIEIVRTGEDVEYLRALVKDLQPHMVNADRYRQIDVALVKTPEIDAYSVPGGHLIFTQGLLDDVESEAELVGVIGHELSHLDRGHQLLPLKQSKTQPQWNNPQAAMQWMATMFKPFRPEYEAQADSDAVTWMLAAGYDARQLARLLARWNSRQNQQAAWTNMLPSFVRSHPNAGQRAQEVLKKFDQAAQVPADLVIGRKNLAERIPSSQKRLD